MKCNGMNPLRTKQGTFTLGWHRLYFILIELGLGGLNCIVGRQFTVHLQVLLM